MWKNYGNKKRRLYSEYVIRGLNRERLINSLQREGITLFDVKIIGRDKLGLRIYYKENKKFFAKLDKLCYNKKDISRVKNSGAFFPVLYLIKNVGVVLGIALFIVIYTISNQYVFSLDFTGSGKFAQNEITAILNENGVGKYKSVKNIDLNIISDKVLANTNSISYLSIRKRGNRLIIDSAKKAETPNLIKVAGSLISPCSGEVESIKVYRGTPLVKVNDIIRAGQNLVSDEMLDKERSIKTGVIAVVSVIESREYTFCSASDCEEEAVLALARESLGDREIISYRIDREKQKDFIYKIQLKFRRIIKSG